VCMVLSDGFSLTAQNGAELTDSEPVGHIVSHGQVRLLDWQGKSAARRGS
jgi:hypothetical protein